jgi:hypothetical protein
MTQLALATWTPRAPKPRPSIEERFAAFHAANPHVLEEMLRLARARRDAGERRIGVKALWEELRRYLFTYAHEVVGVQHGIDADYGYKLDNSLTSRYADKLVEADSSLEPYIERRRRKAK